jgi:hypothetical protein
MSVFADDVLGRNALPPSPLYPVNQLVAPTGTASPATSPAPAPSAPGTASGGIPADGLIQRQVLGLLQPQQQSGFSVPSFLTSLGAGLSSAGQNWNKPAAAAFAGGAGAALQGGQQFQQQQQDARLKALHAAIAAWKVGDLAAYHQAIANFQAANARRQPAASAPAGAMTGASPPAGVGAAAAPAASAAPAVANNSPPAVTPVSFPTSNGSAPMDVLAQARDAIARGAPPDQVLQRLADNGFLPASA